MLFRPFLAALVAVALFPALADACHAHRGLAARVHANREAVRDARHDRHAAAPCAAVVGTAAPAAVPAAPKPAVTVALTVGDCANGQCKQRVGLFVRVFGRNR